MRTTIILIASLAGLALAGCDNAGDPAAEPPIPPAEDSSAAPANPSGSQAREALGEAGDAALDTMENLGEAGRAGLEALQENAPEIRQNVEEAGQRLRNAADAFARDPVPETAGDSPADANPTPEAQEQ